VKLKLTLRRYGVADVDLVATMDAGTTVGDLAGYLSAADPSGGRPAPSTDAGMPTLTLAGPTDTALDPALKVADSGLRSGMTVGLTRTAASYLGAQGESVAVVTVTAGPDTGREFVLRSRTAVIGRDRGCEVRLTDPLISRQHARINVRRVAEVVDLGSANGIEVGGSPVTRARLRPGDTVQLGDSELSVRVAPVTGTGAESAAEGFIRSPRLDPRYEGRRFPAPEPPQRPQATRFPLIAVATPMLMGAVLYLITRSVLSLVFVALSPLMMVGYAIETTFAGRSAYRKALRLFRADVAELTATARAAAGQEVAARNREHPALDECVDAVRRGTPLLWTRRPADPGFGELRLGVGRQPARNEIVLPDGRHLPRDLMAELTALAQEYATVDGVPVVARTAEHGAIGLAGPRESTLGVARALLVQAVALHSPAELVVTAFAANQSARDWEWLKWLPHTTSAHSPVQRRPLASTIEDAVGLVSGLEQLLGQRAAKEAEALPMVLVLVEDDAPVERSRLVDLAEQGWRHGIHVLWLAADTTHLPAACRTFLSLAHPTGTGVAGFVHSGQSVDPLTVESLDGPTATELARRLAPLVDVGARLDDDSDLPRSVSLLAVAERPLSAAADLVIERWLESRSIVAGPYAPAKPAKQPGTLRAVIGRSAHGAHALDLRTDGPHALVGGTTGSGKSELLQSWILALAAAHSPQRLTFLLIDYKGGSAFKDLEPLPHCVGLFTDLDPHEVRRSLVSLSAELRRREKLFATHHVKDLLELEKKSGAEAPPSLVIVVDEFAALVTELPEFVDGMINVAQRGRSLGVHLILATQRPAGVIKDNLRANTNLRLALRTADEADSVDVLGSPQAAFFDSAVPGRAVSKTGPGRLVPFQTGYAGGWTTDEPAPPEIVVEELRFGARTVWEPAEREQSPVDLGPTDIQRLVTALGEARIQARIRRPSRPWLPPLRAGYDVSDPDEVRTGRRDDELVFGIRDNPEEQTQPTVAFRPDIDGNLAVYGTGGSGKSTLLRTIAISAAGFAVEGGPCHVYGLDFGARGLSMLAELPHVGSVIAGTDHERVARLLTWLSQLVADRADRFAKAGAGTITEYRAAPTGVPTEPRILLLLDGVAAFRQAYETGERIRLFDALVSIATDGRPVGVHVLLTADRPASVPSALASAVQTRVVLRMADVNEYQGMNLPADVLKPSSPPGRGLLNGAEIQVAILGRRADVGSQVAALRDFAQDMTQAGVTAAPPIPRLADTVPMLSLPAAVAGRPVLGVAAATLEPHSFLPEGAFLVVGPPLSGRSAALRALAVALRRWNPATRLHFFSTNRKSRLATLPLWTSAATGHEDLAKQAKALVEELTGGLPAQPLAVFIENVAETVNGAADQPLTELVKLGLAEGLFIVAESESSAFNTMGVPGLVRANRYGLALAPDIADADRFRTPFPNRLNRADFPPGRALFVHAGRTSVVQVGWVEEG
jgi:S-DNA-T family DNA segregation ATPase FtsK/SpoIIIE